MLSKLKFAVVAAKAGRLVQRLRTLRPKAEVVAFQDLFRDASALSSYKPSLLFLKHHEPFDELLGGLRMLQSLLPGLAVILIIPRALEVELHSRLGEEDELGGGRGKQGEGPESREYGESPEDRLGMQFLLEPFTRAQLNAAIASALEGDSGQRAESFLDFAHGICDEINNPLLFASGHLQLLSQTLDPENHKDALAQIEFIRLGLGRIEATMQKVGTMSRASLTDRHDEVFELGRLLLEIRQRLQAAALPVELSCQEEAEGVQLRGDLGLLALALFHLCALGHQLSEEDKPVNLVLACRRQALEARLTVARAKLRDWELPRAFEPYYVNRVLRGTTEGLNLFLLRMVARAHGAEATVRRTGRDSVEFLVGLGALEAEQGE